MLRGLSTVSFYAADLAQATRWYTEFLGIEPYFTEKPGYVEFRIGDFQHELGIIDARYAPADPAAGPAGETVFWHVDDVPATLARLLELGATQLAAPRDQGAGFITASVIDPFGNILGVMYNPHYLDVLGGLERVIKSD